MGIPQVIDLSIPGIRASIRHGAEFIESIRVFHIAYPRMHECLLDSPCFIRDIWLLVQWDIESIHARSSSNNSR